MATQNIQIDNRFAAESASMNRIAGKGRSKQNKELLQLASIAQELEQEVAAAKSGAPRAEGKAESKPNVKPAVTAAKHKNFGEEMADLAAVLQMLQVDIVKYQRSKTKDETNISTAMTKMYKLIEKDIEKQIHKQKEEAHKHKLISIFTKVVGALITAVVSTIALVFGQVEIAALMIAMYVIMTTGVMSKAQTELAKGLNAMGIHNKLADEIISAVVILVVVGVASALIAPEDIPEEVANTVENTTEDAAEGVQDAVEMTDVNSEENTTNENSGKTGTKKVSKLRKFLRKIRRSTKENLVIMNVSQSLTQVNLNQIVLDGIKQFGGHLSAKEKEKLELILSIVVAVLAALASLGAGDALADSMSMGEVGGGTSKAAKALGRVFGDVSETTVGRTLSRMSTVLEEAVGPQGPLWLERARRVLVTGEAGLKMGEGSVLVEQGELDAALGHDQAALEYMQTGINSASSEQSDTQKQTTATLKQQRMSDKNLDLFAGEKALARVLTTQSPV